MSTIRTGMLLLFAICRVVFGQSLDDQDIALGLRMHSNMIANTPILSSGETVSIVGNVWRHMIDATSYQGATVATLLFIRDSPEVNASATAGGRLYVNRGLVEAVHGNPGVIAFVIGHEMAHLRLQHSIRDYLRTIRAQYTIRQAYLQSKWAGLAAQTAFAIAEKKIERDEEHEADRLGLLMAAEAGYHPDFAILAARELRITSGESSKFAAFFQGHPRWTTREQRAEGIRDQAIQLFNSRWPSAGTSPGGEPPTLVAIEDFEIRKDQKNVVRVLFASDVRNVNAEAVEISARIIREKQCPPVVVAQKLFAAPEQGQWNLPLDRSKKDKFGKRYIQILATMNGKLLFESNLKKLD